MLSPQLLGILRAYWRLARPAHWLFPAATASIRSTRPRCTPPAAPPRRGRARTSTSPSTRCGTASPPTCSRAAPTSASSRCCSAIATSTTTARYTQVATSTIRGTPSPLDRLRLEVTPPVLSGGDAPALEVADIFRHHGAAFRRAHAGHLGRHRAPRHGGDRGLPDAGAGRARRAVRRLRLVRCAYNSCRNRHCPKCQGLARAEWLEARQAELLPVPYFHVVFTLPGAGRRDRLPEQGGGLRHPVPRRGRDAAQRRRRPPASRRRDRRDRGAAHLGADPAPPSAPALHRPRRRSLARPDALDRVPARLLPAGARAVALLPRAVPGNGCARRSRPANCASPARSPRWPTPPVFADRLADAAPASTGSSTPSRRSPDPSRCWPISAATPIASPSPTAVSIGLDDGQVELHLEGLPPPRQDQGDDAGRRRVHPPLPAAHRAGRVPPHPPLSASSPTAIAPPSWRSAATCSPPRRRNRSRRAEATERYRELTGEAIEVCPCCGGADAGPLDRCHAARRRVRTIWCDSS